MSRISKELQEQLEQKALQHFDENLGRLFQLYTGLASDRFISLDGEICIDEGSGLRLATPEETIATFVASIEDPGIGELQKLLPTREVKDSDCGACTGSGWIQLRTRDGGQSAIVCASCSGLGWRRSDHKNLEERC